MRGRAGEPAPRQFFWASGGLSSFLDNTPTYLVFLNQARGLSLPNEVAGVSHAVLRAISLGSVFMGASAYIGNAPNFTVKSVAEERGVKMPGFFGYMLYSACVLIPMFLGVTFLFFLSCPDAPGPPPSPGNACGVAGPRDPGAARRDDRW